MLQYNLAPSSKSQYNIVYCNTLTQPHQSCNTIPWLAKQLPFPSHTTLQHYHVTIQYLYCDTISIFQMGSSPKQFNFCTFFFFSFFIIFFFFSIYWKLQKYIYNFFFLYFQLLETPKTYPFFFHLAIGLENTKKKKKKLYPFFFIFQNIQINL